MLTIVLFSLNAQSSHYLGSDISLLNIKNQQGQATNQYKIIYRLFASNITQSNRTIFIYTKNTNTLAMTVPMIISNTPSVYSLSNTNCQLYLPNTTFLNIQYESAALDLSMLNNPDGYYFYTVEGPVNLGLINFNLHNNDYRIHTEIPRLDSASPYKFNSNPSFNSFIVPNICVGNPITLDYSASDPDGDSLVYSLIEPPSIGTVSGTQFNSGFSFSNYIPGDPSLKIDSSTGILYLKPNYIGTFYIAVKVEEYRNGVKISEVVRQQEIDILSSCGASYSDIEPDFYFNNNIGSNHYTTIRTSPGSNIQFSLYVLDTGLLKDSLYIEISPANGSANWALLDTSKFKWEYQDSGNWISTPTYNFELATKSTAVLNFSLISYPDLYTNLSGTYLLKVTIRDSKCGISNLKTGYISLTFNPLAQVNNLLDVYAKKGSNVTFNLVGSNLSNYSFQWQSDFGLGFQNLIDNGTYVNTDSTELTISNIKLKNHEQKFRCIYSFENLIDTSSEATLYVTDTIITQIYDTIYTSVTDTLVIQLLPLSLPPLNTNIIKIYPNPSTGKLFISLKTGNQLQNFSYEIINPLGQTINSGLFNFELKEIDLYNWGTKGLYLFNIRDNSSNQVIESKKIILE